MSGKSATSRWKRMNRTEQNMYITYVVYKHWYIYIYIYMYIINKSTHAIKGSKTLEISQCGGVEATI